MNDDKQDNRNLLTINAPELGVWAMLTYYLVGASVKSLAICAQSG
jgi:hypothetical protein